MLDAAGAGADFLTRLADEEARLSRSAHSGLYHDRVCDPADTVASLRPFFPSLGITRLARVTGLDRIGIPVYQAVRPNAKTLAVTQGKGIDNDSARASAVMEAAEQAIAEQPSAPCRTASIDELSMWGEVFVELKRFLAPGRRAPPADLPMQWLWGFDLLGGRVTWAPRDVVRLDFTERRPTSHPFWQSSDGLASGNILLEAILHGLCERIERDASALWSFRTADQVCARCVDPYAFHDSTLSLLIDQIAAGGLQLRLFDITSDIGIPAYFAVLAEPTPTGTSWRHFDLSRGTGAHPYAVRAAIRAVTEAVQSRLTAISAARDDFLPDLYEAPLRADLHVFRLAEPGWIEPPHLEASAGLLELLLRRLRAGGIRSVIVVPIGGEDYGISVAKVIVPDLEDPPESKHRHLGRRAVNAMLAAA